jgi:hypothetical protein
MLCTLAKWCCRYVGNCNDWNGHFAQDKSHEARKTNLQEKSIEDKTWKTERTEKQRRDWTLLKEKYDKNAFQVESALKESRISFSDALYVCSSVSCLNISGFPSNASMLLHSEVLLCLLLPRSLSSLCKELHWDSQEWDGKERQARGKENRECRGFAVSSQSRVEYVSERLHLHTPFTCDSETLLLLHHE